MKIAILLLFLSIPVVSFAQNANAAPPLSKNFDGSWAVTLVVPDHTDEQATAKGFTFHFMGTVKNGVFHGEYGIKEKPPWLSLEGGIKPDGSAEFTAAGITGNPAYNLHKLGAGIPYTYQVEAQFQGAKGAGSRVSGLYWEFHLHQAIDTNSPYLEIISAYFSYHSENGGSFGLGMKLDWDSGLAYDHGHNRWYFVTEFGPPLTVRDGSKKP